MNPARIQRYFKIGEAAKLLGLSQETLRRWEKAGRISFSRTPGGKRLFSEADLDAIRLLLKPTQESIQTSTYQSPDLSARQSERITLSISVPKLRFPQINFDFKKIAVAAFVLCLVAGNIFLFSKTSYSHKAAEMAQTQVLGVKDFIAPALEEAAPLVRTLTKAGDFLKKFKEKSFVVPLIGKSEFADLGDLKVTGIGHFAKDVKIEKDLRVTGTAYVGRLKTDIVDPYLIENDGDVQSFLEIRTKPSALGSADIVFEPGGIEKLRIREGGTVKFSGSIEGIENITATGEIKGGSLSIGGNTFSGTKLTFSGSSPSIYPSTTNTGISLNGNGTGAINIGNSGTGDVYIAGGSGDSGCTITNNNGSLACSSDITSAGNLFANGGSLRTTQTTGNLFNQTVTTLNIGGAATTISLGASTGTTTVNNALAVTGNTTLTGDLAVNGADITSTATTFNFLTSTVTTLNVGGSSASVVIAGRPTFTKAPTSAHTGTFTIDSSTWNVSDASIYINPSTATADSNLLGVAVGGNVKFDVDAEGDVFARNLVLTGNTTTGTTTVSGDLSVEGNTTLGDATTDTLTINPATITLAGGNKTLDLTGAATRTLTLLNSTASQVANLDLSDGSLTTGGTSRLTNAGVLENIAGFTQTSGTVSITSTTASGDVLAFTDTSLTAASSNLANFTFKNANTGAGVALSGVTITEQAAGTPSSGTNTSNLLNLSAAAGGTVNGINISSATGFTNFFKTPTFNLDSSGNVSGVVTLTATTLAGTLSTAAQTNVTSVGTLTSLAVTGNVNSSTGSLQTNGVTRVDNSGNLTAGTGSFGGAITPSLDDTYDLGTAVLRFQDAFFSGDVTAGDLVFKNNFRFTEDGDKGILILNPKGEKIGGFDSEGNFWMKGEIKQWVKN